MDSMVLSLFGLFGGVGYLLNDITGMVYGVVVISTIVLTVGWKSL